MLLGFFCNPISNVPKAMGALLALLHIPPFIQGSGFMDSDTFYALILMLLGFGLSQSKGALLALLHIP